MGDRSGRNMTSGGYNIGIGNKTLYDGGVSGRNTAVGHQSIFQSTCSYRNVAVGYRTAFCLTNGDDNTIVGTKGLCGTPFGLGNTAIGYKNLTGAYCQCHVVALGTNIQTTAIGINYSVGIGKDVSICDSNYLFLGSSTSLLGTKTTVSCTSGKYWKVYINGQIECVLLV